MQTHEKIKTEAGAGVEAGAGSWELELELVAGSWELELIQAGPGPHPQNCPVPASACLRQATEDVWQLVGPVCDYLLSCQVLDKKIDNTESGISDLINFWQPRAPASPKVPQQTDRGINHISALTFWKHGHLYAPAALWF